MFKGIIAKNIDSIVESEERNLWQDRLESLSQAFTKWSREKVGVEVNFQPQIVAMHERKGTADSEEHREQVIKDLNWNRGKYLQLGIDVLVFIYDRFSPHGWLHTPEYDPNPIRTLAFTDVGNTITVAYVEPQYVGGDKEKAIGNNLSYVISLELLHMLPLV